VPGGLRLRKALSVTVLWKTQRWFCRPVPGGWTCGKCGVGFVRARGRAKCGRCGAVVQEIKRRPADTHQ